MKAQEIYLEAAAGRLAVEKKFQEHYNAVLEAKNELDRLERAWATAKDSLTKLEAQQPSYERIMESAHDLEEYECQECDARRRYYQDRVQALKASQRAQRAATLEEWQALEDEFLQASTETVTELMGSA